jgi:hypothetical protein
MPSKVSWFMNPFEDVSANPISALFSNPQVSYVQEDLDNGVVRCQVEAKRDLEDVLGLDFLRLVEDVALSPVVVTAPASTITDIPQAKQEVAKLVEEHCAVSVSFVTCSQQNDLLFFHAVDDLGYVVHDNEECLFALQSAQLGNKREDHKSPRDEKISKALEHRQEQARAREGFVHFSNVDEETAAKLGYDHVQDNVFHRPWTSDVDTMTNVSRVLFGKMPVESVNIELDTTYPRLAMLGQYLAVKAYAQMAKKFPEHKPYLHNVLFVAPTDAYTDMHPMETFSLVANVDGKEALDTLRMFVEQEKKYISSWQVARFSSLATAVAYRWYLAKHGYFSCIVGKYYLVVNTTYPDTFVFGGNLANVASEEQVREDLRQYLVSLTTSCSEEIEPITREPFSEMSLDDAMALMKIDGEFCFLSWSLRLLSAPRNPLTRRQLTQDEMSRIANTELMLRGYLSWSIGDVEVLPGLC